MVNVPSGTYSALRSPPVQSGRAGKQRQISNFARLGHLPAPIKNKQLPRRIGGKLLNRPVGRELWEASWWRYASYITVHRPPRSLTLTLTQASDRVMGAGRHRLRCPGDRTVTQPIHQLRVFERVLDVYLPIRKRRSSSAGVREHTAGCAGATPCTSADSTHSSFSTRSPSHRRGSLCGMGSAGVGSHLTGRVQEPSAILPAASFRLRPSTAGFAPPTPLSQTLHGMDERLHSE